MPAIFVAGNYVDIHDNHNCNIYATEPPSVSPESHSGNTASDSPEPTTEQTAPSTDSNVFRHMTQKCIDENRVDTVNAEITAACKGTSEMLWRTLWNNENLGYLVIASINATTLYKDIEEHYGKLPYKVRQFRAARNNR